MARASFEARKRNSLERGIAKQLEDAGISFGYETSKLSIAWPPRQGKYIPDFIPEKCPIILEGKGWFGRRGAEERQKFLLAKEQHPEWDIRFVFSDANKKIYKGSPTSYAQWCEDHGFQYSTKGQVPPEWLAEIRRYQKPPKRKACR